MKNILRILVISFIFIILRTSGEVFSQWQDKGDYKEIKVSDYAISQIVQVVGDSTFWFHSNSNIVKYDFNGRIVKNFVQIDTTNERIGVTPIQLLSSNGKNLLLFYNQWVISMNYYPMYGTKGIMALFDLETGKIIYENDDMFNIQYPTWNDALISGKPIYCNYIPEQNLLIYELTISEGAIYETSSYINDLYKYHGYTQILNLYNLEFINIDTNCSFDLSFTKDNKFFVVSSYTSDELYNNDGKYIIG